MGRKLRWFVTLAAALAVAGCGSSAPTTSGPRAFVLAGHPMATCSLSNGAVARCGTLTVPENPSDRLGRRIDLRVVIVPAQQAPVAPDPVFFVTGGPGGATSEDWSGASITFSALHLHHDFVLVDQRGTGSSHKLDLPPMNPDETLSDYASRALASLDGDPRYYTTALAMDDLDAVRAALGYGKIDIYGQSYGATAVQFYLRQHADHVRTAILDGGTLIEVPIFELIAANSQRALDLVFDRCLSDLTCATAFPNLRAEFAGVIARLDRAPVTTDVIDQTTGKPVVVTHQLFASVIHSRMLTARDAATIPWLIHRAAGGNFIDVASLASSISSGADPYLVMSYEIRCYEAWARDDPAEVRRTGAGSYYLSAQLESAVSQAAACPLLPKGVVPANDAQPVRTSVPVLLLNGNVDPQDPPSNVAAAQVDMPNSFELVVPGQGHVVGAYWCMPTVISDFITAGKVDAAAAHRCAESVPTPVFRVS